MSLSVCLTVVGNCRTAVKQQQWKPAVCSVLRKCPQARTEERNQQLCFSFFLSFPCPPASTSQANSHTHRTSSTEQWSPRCSSVHHHHWSSMMTVMVVVEKPGLSAACNSPSLSPSSVSVFRVRLSYTVNTTQSRRYQMNFMIDLDQCVVHCRLWLLHCCILCCLSVCLFDWCNHSLSVCIESTLSLSLSSSSIVPPLYWGPLVPWKLKKKCLSTYTHTHQYCWTTEHTGAQTRKTRSSSSSRLGLLITHKLTSHTQTRW